MIDIQSKNVAVIVAHPDDETLWTGGTILNHTKWKCFIITVCRGSDADRAPKFYRALKIYHSVGAMGDLDDGPEQTPIDQKELEETILNLLPQQAYDLIITHDPSGEYTRHLRHEEVSKVVINLWYNNKIAAHEMYTFAYEDGNKMYYPRAIKEAPICNKLSDEIWQIKYHILNDIYGFEEKSWELKTTPHKESFWHFTTPLEAYKWLNKRGLHK